MSFWWTVEAVGSVSELSRRRSAAIAHAAVLSVSLKGETLCSVKDFRINLFIPGAEDMIVLTLGSVASRLLLDKCPAESPQQQGDVVLSD